MGRFRVNKKLNARELVTVGVCLIILGGLAGGYLGSIGSLISGLLVLGGLICLLVAPFSKTKHNSEKPYSKEQETPVSRKRGDLK